MMKQTKEFLIDMVEKELEQELEYLEDEKQNSYNGKLEDEQFQYAWDLRSALFDLYKTDLKQEKGFDQFITGYSYKEKMQKINNKLKELRGE